MANLLWTDVTVEYKSGLSEENIRTEKIEGVDYFNVFELNKVFKATVREDILDHRLHMNLYNEQLIILLDSSYLQYKGEQYNFKYPLVQKNGRYLLPVEFLYKLLPLILTESISRKGEKLLAGNPSDNRIRTIVIDPGHGGKDPGAIGYSKKNFEKNIVLDISKKLQKKLRENLDVEVLLTRSKDEFVSLIENIPKKDFKARVSFLLAYGAGMRVSEVLRCSPEHFRPNSIFIPESKYGVERIVPIPKGWKQEFTKQLPLKTLRLIRRD